MVSEEEIKKAKENINKQLENTKKANECGLATKGEFNEDIDAIETLLQYIEQLEKNSQKYKLALFMVIRNSKVLPRGLELRKSEKEINKMSYQTMQECLKMIDYERAKKFLNEGEK